MPTSLCGATPSIRMLVLRTAWSPSHAVVSAPSSPQVRVAELTANPAMLLLLANLGRPRRPSGVAAPYTEPVLTDVSVASAQLAEVVNLPIAATDLADTRRLQ